VTNASISGETTAGGRARFAAALGQFKPAVVILALGANDGLRGLPVPAMKENLQAMARLAKQAGARVLLVGMRLPPNYGPQYTQDFDAAYRDIAKAEKLALLPFLLEPIALERDAYQADGLHPTAAAQPKILDHVWGALKPLLG
jgi:acyl-CoA thioesterase-1